MEQTWYIPNVPYLTCFQRPYFLFFVSLMSTPDPQPVIHMSSERLQEINFGVQSSPHSFGGLEGKEQKKQDKRTCLRTLCSTAVTTKTVLIPHALWGLVEGSDKILPHPSESADHRELPTQPGQTQSLAFLLSHFPGTLQTSPSVPACPRPPAQSLRPTFSHKQVCLFVFRGQSPQAELQDGGN